MSKCTLCSEPAVKEVRLVTVDRNGGNSKLTLNFTCNKHARTILNDACADRERRVERFAAINIEEPEYIPDEFDKDYREGCQKDFTRQARAWKAGVFSE
jgi:hypothetical protein